MTLDTKVFGYTLTTLGISVALFLAVILFVYIFKRVLLKRVASLVQRTDNMWDDRLIEVFEQTRVGLFVPLAIYVATASLKLPTRAATLIAAIAAAAILLQVGIWLDRLINKGLDIVVSRGDPAKATTMSMLGLIGRALLWVLLLFVGLDTFGINISALVAGLGIGGVAVALAAQNILGDLFASLSIVFDKPFLIGDFVIVDDKMGTVEHIGIKTTRVRSLSGEQVIFSNADLLKSRIRNYKRMYERRIVFTVGVTYQTTPDQLAKIPQIIRETIEGTEKTRFDRSHFSQFGDFSLNFETVYYVLDPDYNLYMDLNQKISFTIIRKFAKEGIEFAYPTQTLYLSRATA
jgi:small-conductance mechanosensitive channel